MQVDTGNMKFMIWGTRLSRLLLVGVVNGIE